MDRTFTIAMPMPSRELTLNRMKRGKSARAKQTQRVRAAQHRSWAETAAQAATSPEHRPYFGAGVEIGVTLRVERGKGGQRWDDAAVIEALKPYMDGFQGYLYPDDKMLRWVGAVEWDDAPSRPYGASEIFITLGVKEQEERQPDRRLMAAYSVNLDGPEREEKVTTLIRWVESVGGVRTRRRNTRSLRGVERATLIVMIPEATPPAEMPCDRWENLATGARSDLK